MSTPGGPKLNPVEQPLGGRATFIGGVWIQALRLLGRREVVRTVANMPPSIQYRRVVRAAQHGLQQDSDFERRRPEVLDTLVEPGPNT